MPERTPAKLLKEAAETDREKDGIMSAPITMNGVQKMLATLIALATILLSTGGGYLVFKSVTDYRLSEIDKKIESHEGRIVQMEKFGHEDYERRITKLENTGGDRLAVEVQEHSKQIQALADAVKQDHDAIIRVVTILEEQMRHANGGAKLDLPPGDRVDK